MDPRGLGSSSNILIWLSPLCRPGVGGVVLVGRKPVEELAVDRVDDALEAVHVRRRALAEVGPLRVPPADVFQLLDDVAPALAVVMVAFRSEASVWRFVKSRCVPGTCCVV